MIGFKQTAKLALLVACLTLGNTVQAGLLLYDIIDLGTLGGNSSFGSGINDSGQVVGSSYTADGRRHAFVTNSNGQMIDLGTLGGIYSDSVGVAINDSGQVTGWTQIANGNYYPHAFVTNLIGQMMDLGTLGGFSSNGVGINASGQVSGTAQGSSTTDNHNIYGRSHAFVTSSNGEMIDLGTLGGYGYEYGSNGSGINDSGQVVGYSPTTDGTRVHAFVTSLNGQMTDLGTLGGNDSYGKGINASGQVTGQSQTADGISYDAFVTNLYGQMIDLGSFGGIYSAGIGINDYGQVVGWADTANNGNGSPHAFVTNNDVMNDLNTLLVASTTGWILTQANGINDSGQITGTGIHNGLTRAFLLTPATVPIPATIWLFTSGLGLLAFTHRRKQQNIGFQLLKSKSTKAG